MNQEKKMAIAAIVLLVIAAVILTRYFASSKSGFKPAPTRADIAKQITDIQNDPHMPAQAKAIAIGELKAHMEGTQAQQGAPAPGK